MYISNIVYPVLSTLFLQFLAMYVFDKEDKNVFLQSMF